MAKYLQDEMLKEGIEKYKINNQDISTIFLAGAPGA